MTGLAADVRRTVRAMPDTVIRARFLDLLASQPLAVDGPMSPGAHVTASAMVVHPDRRRVLLCLHGRLRQWLHLGGHCEVADLTLVDTALREVAEESGLTDVAAVGPPLAIDIHPITCRYGKALHYDVSYPVLAAKGVAAVVISDEATALGWFGPMNLPHPSIAAVSELTWAALAWAGHQP